MTRLYFDASCGLCQGAVRFLAHRDRARRIRFAPLGGSTFLRRVPLAHPAGLGETLVVQTATGEVLVRSEGVIHLLRQLSLGWRLLATGLSWVPPALRNGAYAWVARHRQGGRACPRDIRLDDRFEP